MISRSIAATAFALSCCILPAQAEVPYYQGKTITVVVGLSPGGSTDIFVRSFADVMARNIPGKPTIVVQNMPGSGGVIAANHVLQKGKPDGLTIYWSNWSPISQVLGLETVPVPYDEFEFIGGVGDSRVVYARNDVVPGGLKSAADIARASQFNVGGSYPAGSQDVLMRLSLDILGLEYNYVPGYEGGTEIYTAVLRNEVQVGTTAITTFRTRNRDLVDSGVGRGLYYLARSDSSGNIVRPADIPDMPAFQDLYQQINGKAPSGPDFEALNWLTPLSGDLTIVALAPPNTNPEALAALRAGYDAATKDAEFRERSIKMAGRPYSFIGWQEGGAILATLADVPDTVRETLRRIVDSAK
jgi:tripartite-type tricarboxylate transporter receptor subunit TctC